MFKLEPDCLEDGEISTSCTAMHGQIIFGHLLQLEGVFWKTSHIPLKLVP